MADMTVDDIADLYRSGASLKTTAEACGLGARKVRDVLAAHGVEIRAGHREADPRVQLRNERIERLWRNGKQQTQIAKLFGISTGRVNHILKQRGCISGRRHA